MLQFHKILNNGIYMQQIYCFRRKYLANCKIIKEKCYYLKNNLYFCKQIILIDGK